LRTFGIEDIDSRQELANACQSEALRALFTAWMSAAPPIVEAMVAVVLAGAERYLRSGAAEFAAEATTLVELAARYPGDSGVLAALLLNRITLAPGDALFLPAGNLHAYLRGVAVEGMANSDNVLRGGLTSKHVDVPELLHILDFNPVTHDQLRPLAHRDGLRVVYTPPVDEFAVSVWSLVDGYHGREVTALRDEQGPYILLCTQGCVAVRNAHTTFTLRRGQAAWVPAHDRPVCLYADQPATVFGAGVSPSHP
jgi:mannose-6-phosphate isomerase